MFLRKTSIYILIFRKYIYTQLKLQLRSVLRFIKYFSENKILFYVLKEMGYS